MLCKQLTKQDKFKFCFLELSRGFLFFFFSAIFLMHGWRNPQMWRANCNSFSQNYRILEFKMVLAFPYKKLFFFFQRTGVVLSLPIGPYFSKRSPSASELGGVLVRIYIPTTHFPPPAFLGLHLRHMEGPRPGVQ